MGHSFQQTKKRWRNIEIGEKIVELIEEMKNEDYKLRPSIDKLLERLRLYCDEKNYFDSIDIVPFLNENKTFIQTPFNNDISLLKKFLSKEIPISFLSLQEPISPVKRIKNFTFSEKPVIKNTLQKNSLGIQIGDFPKKFPLKRFTPKKNN